MTQYIVRFMLGGILMLAVTVISNRSMTVAGVLSAMPIFSGAAFLLNMIYKTSSEMSAQAEGGILGMCAGLVFFSTVWMVMNYHVRSEVAFGIGFCATTLFIGVAFIVGK